MAKGRTESWGCRFRSRRPAPPCSPPTWSPSSALTKSAPSLDFVESPETRARWGNYPQVQSQAALMEAVLASWPPERRAENRGRR